MEYCNFGGELKQYSLYIVPIRYSSSSRSKLELLHNAPVQPIAQIPRANCYMIAVSTYLAEAPPSWPASNVVMPHTLSRGASGRSVNNPTYGGDKKPYELPSTCVRGVCPTFTDQKNLDKLDVRFHCQPSCRQRYRTRPVDIEIPSTRDSPTGGPLGSPQHRESREISMRIGTSG
ncbi:hypothetical protein EVAR_81165_1 [Eumeta japonica]|uniref:Uncharacterized protein n=1 Tax=Eumeta variegata TaxID=151549 RepID=A0A4C1UKX0_EUMVA|nr:hypothetical protein EVAR_81165_1 [Eumeta japonica]